MTLAVAHRKSRRTEAAKGQQRNFGATFVQRSQASPQDSRYVHHSPFAARLPSIAAPRRVGSKVCL